MKLYSTKNDDGDESPLSLTHIHTSIHTHIPPTYLPTYLHIDPTKLPLHRLGIFHGSSKPSGEPYIQHLSR